MMSSDTGHSVSKEDMAGTATDAPGDEVYSNSGSSSGGSGGSSGE